MMPEEEALISISIRREDSALRAQTHTQCGIEATEKNGGGGFPRAVCYATRIISARLTRSAAL